MNRPRRPTPPPLTKTERQALEDLIRRGARALNPAEGNRLLRLLELDQADRQQERRTAGGLMAQVQQLGGQLKDMTARAEKAEGTLTRVVAECSLITSDARGKCDGNADGSREAARRITAVIDMTACPFRNEHGVRCGRPAGHPEAYCRSSDRSSYWLANATPSTPGSQS